MSLLITGFGSVYSSFENKFVSQEKREKIRVTANVIIKSVIYI